MKTISLCVALLIGCLAVAVVGDDPYCPTGNCPYTPRVQPQVVKVESGSVVQPTQSVQAVKRQPVRRVFQSRPVRGFFKRIFCR
jgi:hypothetical protein